MEVLERSVQTDINAGGSTIGCLISRYPLESPEFEVVVVRFNEDYHGREVESQNNAMTYSRNYIGYDQDIVAPIVTIISNRRDSINVLASGMISSVDRTNKTVVESNRCSVTITTAGSKPNIVAEWNINLPQHLDLTRKIVYIERFHVYITAANISHLEELKVHKVINVAPGSVPTPLITVHAKGNIKQARKLYYTIKDLVGYVMVEPSAESQSEITISAHVVTGKIDHRFVVSNKDMTCMDESLYTICTEMDDSEMLFDYDLSRLRSNYEKLKANTVSKDKSSMGVVTTMRAEIERLKAKISEDEVKLAELKLQQEEWKTKREEIKTVSTASSADSSAVSDTLKVGGAVLGLAGVVTAAIVKYGIVGLSAASLVEWAIPVFGVAALGITAGISLSLFGISALIGGVIGFITGFFW